MQAKKKVIPSIEQWSSNDTIPSSILRKALKILYPLPHFKINVLQRNTLSKDITQIDLYKGGAVIRDFIMRGQRKKHSECKGVNFCCKFIDHRNKLLQHLKQDVVSH